MCRAPDRSLTGACRSFDVMQIPGDKPSRRLMTVQDPLLDLAIRRLAAALDQLEAAVERLGQAGEEKRDLEDTLAAVQDDRSRLAEDLATATARARALETASAEVAGRLGKAGSALRSLLAAAERD